MIEYFSLHFGKRLNLRAILYNLTTAIKIGGIETFYTEIAKILKNNALIYTGYGKFLDNKDLNIKYFKFIKNPTKFFGNRFYKFSQRLSFFLCCKNLLKADVKNFDIFVLSKPYDFFVAKFVKSYNPQIKTIFVSGGEDFYFFDKFFIRYIDTIISVSKENAEILKNRYKDKEIIIIPNGVDKEKFRPNIDYRNEIRDKFNIPNNQNVFLCVARLIGWKGIDLAIRAMENFKNDKLFIIGTGDDEYRLKKITKELNLIDNVVFLGEINRDEIPKFFNACDVFIQPSIGHEAFGITVIEALACDKVCVVSDNGGMRDIIQNGVNGYKFEISNVADLCDKLNLALKYKNILEPRKSIDNKYEWGEFIKGFEK